MINGKRSLRLRTPKPRQQLLGPPRQILIAANGTWPNSTRNGLSTSLERVVSSARPGFVDITMITTGPGECYRVRVGAVPLSRMGVPEDIAAGILCLDSPVAEGSVMSVHLGRPPRSDLRTRSPAHVTLRSRTPTPKPLPTRRYSCGFRQDVQRGCTRPGGAEKSTFDEPILLPSNGIITAQ